jgi:hypothetical protein
MKRALIILGTLFLSTGMSMRIDAAEVPTQHQPVVRPSLRNDISPPLRDLKPVPPAPESRIREIPIYRRPPPLKPQPRDQEGEWRDPMIQDQPGPALLPSPLQSFEGLSNAVNQQVVGGLAAPADANGDVGPNHYVQWVNLIIAIFNKSGTLIAGPVPGNALWSGFGGLCQTENQGDPIVLHDHLADRWFLSQYAWATDTNGNPTGPFVQCIAVSTSPDPTGTYFRYAFQISTTKLNDYPKFGVWPDAYYLSVNQFQFAAGTWAFAGAGVAAFERAKMLQGQPAQMVFFDLGTLAPSFYGLLPSDLDGQTPPNGTPNFFASFSQSPTQQLNIWQFHVDFGTPANSTFGLNGQPNVTLATAPFNTNFGFLCLLLQRCVRQPATLRGLDAIPDRLMYRLQYRYFGSFQTLVTNHTVNAATGLPPKAGIRWYVLLDSGSGSGWSIFQQGTYAPDADSRWMGSAAMDGLGNIALGFSVSSPSTFPSIRYVGRSPSDPLGTLPQGETTLIAGSGSQTGTARWGDYSMLAVDPTDDCTFWYTQEYYTTTSSAGWQTRIGSFKFPACGAP